ncbi:mesenchyme-specific cell surface glycoprotein-like [Anneissia japonica]|uniref:mesenchyme-specific cell surface glycoprotein-like n=1 Tax=Anneissia japonica TaxID=1529436 RepID=UPI0014258FF8|nr:mesenchyme-specific cell surface glycoprotein-like [Anneissia japonica]
MFGQVNQNLFCLILFSTSVNAVYQLEPISTIYIPSSYDSTDSPKYTIDGGAVEQSAYDKNEKLVYAAGSSYLHVVDFSAVSNPVILKKVPTLGVANDIELCGNYVAITVSSKNPNQNGTVCVYELYNRNNGNFPMVQTIIVGSEPDMLKFTKDCRTILVANEGEGYTSDDEEDIVNPEGSVSIIRFTSDDLSTIPTISTADFMHFNSRSDEYEMKHIRYPYKGYISKTRDTFSQNLEPEYIALNSNESKAYIALQENNAIAIVDMATSSVDEIIGMGVKSWENLKFDASDKDSGINLQSWPVYSFYQPDSMIHYEIDGVEYLATSNEGDSFEYETKNNKWEEKKRGAKLVKDLLISDSIPENVTKYLEDKDELGRLEFSTVDGLDKNGKIETLYHYGGRSWSIFRIDGDNLTMIYDSGDDVERMMSLYYPEVFNGNTKPDDANEEKPEDLFDTRSDNKLLSQIGALRLFIMRVLSRSLDWVGMELSLALSCNFERSKR